MKEVNVINDLPTKNDRATVLADYEMGYKGIKCP